MNKDFTYINSIKNEEKNRFNILIIYFSLSNINVLANKCLTATIPLELVLFFVRLTICLYYLMPIITAIFHAIFLCIQSPLLTIQK